MPNKIVSKAQQRFLFATNPTLARELAGGQSFRGLPERKGEKPHNKKKPHRTKHASPLDPAVDADALVEKLALGTLGSAPRLGSGLGLVRPTLKPQGVTLSAINANRPTLSLKPKVPALSPTPAQAPAPTAGTGQLGEQTAQAVVQTARNQAPDPARVGTPPAPSVPKLGSHGLARRDVVAALIGGPDYSSTPHTGECDTVKEAGDAPGPVVEALPRTAGVGSWRGGSGVLGLGTRAFGPGVKEAGDGGVGGVGMGVAYTGTGVAGVGGFPRTAPNPGRSTRGHVVSSNVSAHDAVSRVPVLGLAKLAHPLSVLGTTPETSPLSGAAPKAPSAPKPAAPQTALPAAPKPPAPPAVGASPQSAPAYPSFTGGWREAATANAAAWKKDLLPGLAGMDDEALRGWVQKAPVPTRLALADMPGYDPRLRHLAYASLPGDAGLDRLGWEDLDHVGSVLGGVKDPRFVREGERLRDVADMRRYEGEAAAYPKTREEALAAQAAWDAQYKQVQQNRMDAARRNPLSSAARWAGNVLSGGTGAAPGIDHDPAELDRMQREDPIPARPADPAAPRLRRGRVWVDGLDAPLAVGREYGRPYDPNQVKQYAQRAGVSEAAAEAALRGQAQGYGWNPAAEHEPGLRPSVSPVDLMTPAGLAGMARATAGAGTRLLPAAAKAESAAARAGATAAKAEGAAAQGTTAGATAAAAPAGRAMTTFNAARQTAAAALDPLGSLAAGLGRYGAGDGVVPALARWAGRGVSAAAAVPRYTTGMAFAGNTLRGGSRGLATLGGAAPILTAGLTGTPTLEALAAPLTYPGRWARSVADLLGGDPSTAANLVADPYGKLNKTTLDPLNRVAGNAAANAESWHDPVTRPLGFLLDKALAGGKNLLTANAGTFADPAASSAKAVADAAAANRNPDQVGRPNPLLGNPADPNAQYRLFGPNGEADRRARADAHIAGRKAPGQAPPGPAATPGLTPDQMDDLASRYADLTARGDVAGAEGVKARMLDAVGGDATRLPLTAAVPDLDEAAFPGMTRDQFGAMIDAGEGAGAFARYTAAGQDLAARGQALQARFGGSPPDPNDPEVQKYEADRRQYAQLRQKVQGRAAAHYENTVLGPMKANDVPAFADAYKSLQERIKAGQPVDPDEVAGLQAEGHRLVSMFGGHALRKAVTEGARTADGTPVKDAAEFLREAGRTEPVLGPDGKPMTQVVEGPQGPVRVPLTRPAGPIAQAVQANIDRQVLAMIPGRPGLDAQGRPTTEHLVDPGIGRTVFERMDPQSRMLTYAGLGLGAIGLLGSMFGFGGSWLPLLGLLGGGFGLYRGTGGDFGKLLSGDFWKGLAGGGREEAGAETLDAMAKPNEALGGSPMGQVSLAGLQQSPVFADLVAGKLPAAQTLQAIAAVRPHEREQLRQLAGANPNVGRMIDQVNAFDAQRGRQADQAAAGPPPAAPGQAPAGGPTTLREYYASMGISGRDDRELNANVAAWLKANPDDGALAAAVARMPPPVRDEAVRGLQAEVDRNGGWAAVNSAAWLSADAKQALRLGKALGVPGAR